VSDSDNGEDISLTNQTDTTSDSEVEEVDRVLQPVLSRASIPAASITQRRQMTWKQKDKHEVIITHNGSASFLTDYSSLIHLLN
jgi:hypothetical protein